MNPYPIKPEGSSVVLGDQSISPYLFGQSLALQGVIPGENAISASESHDACKKGQV